MNIYNLTSYLICSLVALFLLTTCSSDESSEIEKSTDNPSYQVKGRFLSLNTEGPFISVVHEAIPDVMNAMRMNMNIKHIEDAADLSRGDIISFTLNREGMSWYATDIKLLPKDTELNLPENLQQLGVD